MYKRVKISFITGHNPDLLILSKPVKRIDLTGYNTTEHLHELFISTRLYLKEEFKPKMCRIWIKKYCYMYRRYMKHECNTSCPRHELR